MINGKYGFYVVLGIVLLIFSCIVAYVVLRIADHTADVTPIVTLLGTLVGLLTGAFVVSPPTRVSDVKNGTLLDHGRPSESLK